MRIVIGKHKSLQEAHYTASLIVIHFALAICNQGRQFDEEPYLVLHSYEYLHLILGALLYVFLHDWAIA